MNCPATPHPARSQRAALTPIGGPQAVAATRFLASLALVVALSVTLASCGAGDSDAPEPTVTPQSTPTETARVTPTAAQPDSPPATAAPVATGTPTGSGASTGGGATTGTATSWSVTNSGGSGVAVRDSCEDAARTSAPGDGIRDGTAVQHIETGVGACRGWALVEDERGRESWVRLRYLANEDAARWPAELNVNTATWGEVIALDGEPEKACVAEQLTPRELEAAITAPVITDHTTDWEDRIHGCLSPELLAAVAVETAGRTISAEQKECLHRYGTEMLAIDHNAFIVDRDADPRVEAVGAAMAEDCFGNDTALVLVGGFIQILIPGIDLNLPIVECLRSSELVRSATAAGESPVPTEEFAFEIIALTAECAPAELVEWMVSTIAEKQLLNESEATCLREQLQAEDVVAALVAPGEGTTGSIRAMIHECSESGARPAERRDSASGNMIASSQPGDGNAT